METLKTDVLVIGGGPGGYVAAIRLGQLGKNVTLVEKDNMGGVCLNWGCIPSKALIHAAKTFEKISKAGELGIHVSTPKIDFKKTQEWKRSLIKKLTGGISQLALANGVRVISGVATFESPTSAKISQKGKPEQLIQFQHAIIAGGSVPIDIPGFEVDHEKIVDSKDALEFETIPSKMTIIGGGVIGLEIGMLYQKLGTQVSVVELSAQLLPGMDAEIAKTLEKICTKKGMEIFLNSKALNVEKSKSDVTVYVDTPKGRHSLTSSVVMMSVGRKPNAHLLGLSKIPLPFEKHIQVNEFQQTALKHIYAIGDITGGPLLAHRASKQGLVAAEHLAGLHAMLDVRAMPGAVFTDPEISSVGLTEIEAQKQNIPVRVGKFSFAASGRAMASNETEGFVKVIGDKNTDRLLGVHIIGANASELIASAALAIEMGATVEDLALTVHPHPTFSEGLMEAAEALHDKAIHMINKKK